MMPYPAEIIEIDIDGRTFWVRPVGEWVLQSNNVVAEALAVSLDKPLEWATGSSSGTWNLAWNCGRSLPGFRGSMIKLFSWEPCS